MKLENIDKINKKVLLQIFDLIADSKEEDLNIELYKNLINKLGIDIPKNLAFVEDYEDSIGYDINGFQVFRTWDPAKDSWSCGVAFKILDYYYNPLDNFDKEGEDENELYERAVNEFHASYYILSNSDCY